MELASHDAPRRDKKRRVTAIVCALGKWQAVDGGRLESVGALYLK